MVEGCIRPSVPSMVHLIASFIAEQKGLILTVTIQ